jgi:AcrR family transcriptional regulator
MDYRFLPNWATTLTQLSMAKNRLSKEDWIAAGFQALSTGGPSALKAEPLARGLGTTKGSFYWHFDDVPAFQAAMLSLWEEKAFSDVIAGLGDEPNPVKRLRALGSIAAENTPEEFGGSGAEPAIRAWSRESDAVAEAVKRVDQKRLDYVHGLLSEIDLTNPELARLLYGAHVGMADLTSRDGQGNSDAMGTLVDLILALYEEA